MDPSPIMCDWKYKPRATINFNKEKKMIIKNKSNPIIQIDTEDINSPYPYVNYEFENPDPRTFEEIIDDFFTDRQEVKAKLKK